MRSGPIGWYSESIEECLQLAKSSAEVTHNHPEGIKGAQAVAIAVFLARNGHSKSEIKQFIEVTFQYSLNSTLAEIMPNYSFQIACQDSVPEAIICFLESESTEDAIRKAVMLNGDTDTQACIAGGIAEAFYRDISSATEQQINAYLTDEIKIVLDAFKLCCKI
jgi:ADP-ribosylglycohydrolase